MVKVKQLKESPAPVVVPQTLQTVVVPLKDGLGEAVICPKCRKEVLVKYNDARKIAYAACEGRCHVTLICNGVSAAVANWHRWADAAVLEMDKNLEEQEEVVRRLTAMAVKMQKASKA